MRKPVKLAIGIYLGTILIISCSYLILILIGSVQGNDMKGAVTDVSHTEQVKSSTSSTPNNNSQLYKFSQNLQLQLASNPSEYYLTHALYKLPIQIPSIS
jgi:hypothetical protein